MRASSVLPVNSMGLGLLSKSLKYEGKCEGNKSVHCFAFIILWRKYGGHPREKAAAGHAQLLVVVLRLRMTQAGGHS